jgi:hypothetical protein
MAAVGNLDRITQFAWTTAEEDSRPELLRVRLNYARALMRLGFAKEARDAVGEDFPRRFQNRMNSSLAIAASTNFLASEWS